MLKRSFRTDKATLFIVLPIIPCVTAIDKHFYPLLIEEFYKLKYCSTVVYMVPRA